MTYHEVKGTKTMAQIREKFATQVSREKLAAIRDLAHREGRQLQAIVEEALTDLLEKRRNHQPRSQVMDAYFASHSKYADLYKKLAE